MESLNRLEQLLHELSYSLPAVESEIDMKATADLVREARAMYDTMSDLKRVTQCKDVTQRNPSAEFVDVSNQPRGPGDPTAGRTTKRVDVDTP